MAGNAVFAGFRLPNVEAEAVVIHDRRHHAPRGLLFEEAAFAIAPGKGKTDLDKLCGRCPQAGGGVLGTQIGLMCAYAGKDVTFWLRSEGSIERTRPKIERYSSLMLQDLLGAKAYIGNPMGGYLYPKGLIREWKGITAEAIDALAEQAKKNFAGIHIELDLAKALTDADVVIGLCHLGIDKGSAANGYRSTDLLAHVNGVDFVIDGHSHTTMTIGENGEPIQSTGTQFAYIGAIVIDNAHTCTTTIEHIRRARPIPISGC